MGDKKIHNLHLMKLLANLFKLLADSFLCLANSIRRIFTAAFFPKKFITKNIPSNTVTILPYSLPLPSSFSLDIWVDISLFLDVEQRQRLLLVNYGIWKAIEKVGIQKLWRTEEQAIAAGDLLITNRNMLIYQANFVQLLGRQNLFFRIRMRIVENVDAGKLGRGDALIVAVEYKPLGDDDKYEKMLPILDDLKYLDELEFMKRFGDPSMKIFGSCIKWWKEKNLKKAISKYHNNLRRFEQRLLITSGRLLWGRNHQIFIKGYTLVFRCRLKTKHNQTYIPSSCPIMPKKYKKGNVGIMECHHPGILFNFEDSFTFEFCRPLPKCWPRSNSLPYIGPIDINWLNNKYIFGPRNNYIFDFINLNNNDLEFTMCDHFTRPQCHLHFAENELILHFKSSMFYLNDELEIYENEYGLNIRCIQPDILFYNDGKGSIEFFHRLIRIPANIQKNSLIWEKKRIIDELYLILRFRIKPNFIF